MTEEIPRTNAAISEFVVTDERECEGCELRSIGAHDVLVARFYEQVRDVEPGDVADLIDDRPVSRRSPRDTGAAR
jgi:hypothetical protein